MNFCLVCRSLGSSAPGGLATATSDLAVALAQDGHTVHLITGDSVDRLPELPGVRVVRVSSGSTPAVLAGAEPESAAHDLLHAAAVYRAVRRLHEREQPVDAVIAPLWRSEGAVCLLDQRLATVVSCMTSLQTLTEVDDSYLASSETARRLSLERASLQTARYLHGLTEAVLRKTIDDHGLEPDRTVVIGRGLRDRRRLPATAMTVSAFPDHGEPPDLRDAPDRSEPVRVLFVGRIEARKGVDVLLSAARELLSEGVGVRFTLAGPLADPSIAAPFELEAAQRAYLRNAVRFTDAVSAAELAALYEESEIVCVPSRYESHGVVLLEAMMYGKPIITCEAGGIGEVVTAGQNALVCQPGDAAALADSLRLLVADPSLRARLGAAGRESYERRFDAQTIARSMQAFVEQVIPGRVGAGPSDSRVDRRLEELLREVLSLPAQAARTAAAELLEESDPVAEQTVARLRAAALTIPPPPRAAKPRTPRVSAVVITRNHPWAVCQALDALHQSERPPRAIVVDNGSVPAVSERLANACAAHPGTELRRIEGEQSRSAAHRYGVSLADSEFVLLLDDGAEPMPGALDQLVADLDANPNAGAVGATVVGLDGVVRHSGGSLRRGGGLVTLDLIAAGSQFADGSVPASGPSDWVPGSAVLVRRELLEAFPIDELMGSCCDDIDWCLRVAVEHPDGFRRCREALVLDRSAVAASGDAGRDLRFDLDRLASIARFHERHGVLPAPALFETVPELLADDGSFDLGGARLLLELIRANGADWAFSAWSAGDLAGILEANRRQVELRLLSGELADLRGVVERSRRESERLQEAVCAQEAALATISEQLTTVSLEADFLRRRHETLRQVEQGGWWRLRGRLLPAIALAQRARAELDGVPSALRSRTATRRRAPRTHDD